ncbi:MAG: hypothetical protein IJA87_02965 [Clostridia bacterium]|nr:hypothetical protein [Clostridia bacterium]
MQTSSLSKRLLAVILAAAMMLTAIPFTVTADDAKDTLVFGSYNGNALVWEVLEKEADGDLLIVTKDVIKKAKFAASAPDFATSDMYKELNSNFYATFTEAEKAAIATTTITYSSWDATAASKTEKTVTANVVLPTSAMATKYSFGKATLIGTTTATAYYLADSRADRAADVNVISVATTGKLASASCKVTTTGYRALITLKAGSYAQFPAAEGVSYTVNDQAVTYYSTVAATSFKVVVDAENYDASELAVALGTEALTAADGVYTIPAGSAAELSLSGVKAQPADFTAYDAAVAQAAEVDRDLCDTTDLDAALAVDVSACTKLEQAKVDEAAAAILDAIANLKYKPADTAAYLKALAELRVIKANEPVQITETLTSKLYNLNAQANEIGDDFNNVIAEMLNTYEDRAPTPISSYTIDKQADVDAATAAIEDVISRVPLMRASTASWSSALNQIRNLSPNRYSNAAELIAEANALAAETDYVALNLDITHQAEIDEATAKLRAIAAKAEVIPADFTALDAALGKADTYVAENFYTEEEMAGAGEAWNAFVKARDAALAIDRSLYTTYADNQSAIDTLTATLVKSMEALVAYERLTEMEEDFINPTKDFFTKIMDFFGMISGLLVALAGLLPLVIIGELVLYDVFVMIGDEDLLAFVEKIGIKPPEEEPVPEEA